MVAALGLVLLLASACKNSEVPNFQAPNVDPTTPQGVQQAVTGVFAGSRNEMGNFILGMSSMARDAMNYTTTDSRYITEWGGFGNTIPNSDFYGAVVWDNQFRIAKNAQSVITNLPNVKPTYSASDANLITGVMKTMQAWNLMLPLISRDTAGVPIFGFTAPASTPAPILCANHAWTAISAMLDTAETALDAATPGPLPITLPPGFASASAAGPASTAGTFASFNRALRARAGLEQAYAIARATAGSAPTPASPGVPDHASLASADSAARASAIFDSTGTIYVQLTPTDYADPLGVYQTFSGTSGDQANPIQGGLTTIFVMNSALANFNGDPRRGKLIGQISAPNSAAGSSADSAADSSITIGTYTSPSSPIPLVRSEGLVLIDAAIQLGLGNPANAITLINRVRAAAGAPPFAGPATYAAVRDQLLNEFQLSTILESSQERLSLIRDYGLQGTVLNTWVNEPTGDTHASLLPIPIGENSARGGNVTCQ